MKIKKKASLHLTLHYDISIPTATENVNLKLNFNTGINIILIFPHLSLFVKLLVFCSLT